MAETNLRRTRPIFPIGPVMELTDLTARQIRYYEEHGLITPVRTKGNRRLFSLKDLDKLLEIKGLLDQGVNMAGLKQILALKRNQNEQVRGQEEEEKLLSNEEVRRILRKELVQAGRFHLRSSQHGNMNHRRFH